MNEGTSDDDIRAAEEKFFESKELAEAAMFNLLENEVEQLLQLSAFVEAELNYHRQSCSILQQLGECLNQKCKEASDRPKREFVSKKPVQSDFGDNRPADLGGSFTAGNDAVRVSPTVPTPPNRDSRLIVREPQCEALYDFEAENPGELAFKEGDTIRLISHIDENWLEGCINGKTGYFPVTYVKIVVDTDKQHQ